MALWHNNIPAILTSGTLMAGGSFHRTRQRMGLSSSQRLEDFIAESPFNYRENCILYIPGDLPKTPMAAKWRPSVWQNRSAGWWTPPMATRWCCFTSYSLMGAVLQPGEGPDGLPADGGLAAFQDVIHRFKQTQNAVLFAAGSCWEGVDFPGNMVSSLIIVRLPFPVPDPLSEAEREQYPTLQDYIKTVVIPDMQVKLRQGFGRAIRTETDTCVVSILDHRAAPESDTIKLCWKPCHRSASVPK